MARQKDKTHAVDWQAVARSREFQELIRFKRRFIIPNVIFFLVFYFTLPVSTSYFTFLNEKAIGSVNYAYLFAFAQFVMTWALCMIYSKRANEFDAQVEKIAEQALQGKKEGVA